MDTKRNQNPGPGTYNPSFRATELELPKYSLKGRHPAHKEDQKPSPGTYDYKFPDKNSAPAFGFGSSPQRQPLGKEEGSPGPGSYRIPVKIAKKNDYV